VNRKKKFGERAVVVLLGSGCVAHLGLLKMGQLRRDETLPTGSLFFCMQFNIISPIIKLMRWLAVIIFFMHFQQ